MTNWITVDGNEATAMIAHRTNEVIAIYPPHLRWANTRTSGRLPAAKTYSGPFPESSRCRARTVRVLIVEYERVGPFRHSQAPV
jgi:hypothetical protein